MNWTAVSGTVAIRPPRRPQHTSRIESNSCAGPDVFSLKIGATGPTSASVNAATMPAAVRSASWAGTSLRSMPAKKRFQVQFLPMPRLGLFGYPAQFLQKNLEGHRSRNDDSG